MYKIIFYDVGTVRSETYGGGTYVVSGEKYAVLNNKKPKLFKSEKVARNAAEKLFTSCVNTGISYSIEEV